MMWYKCLDCGHIFEEGEQKVWKENRGEFWGRPVFEEITGCPVCKGVYEEAKLCEECGSVHFDDALSGGLCDECIDKYNNNVSICYYVGKNDEKEIKLNGFLATIFEVAAIEDILFNYLIEKSQSENVDCSEYINQDRDWFVREVKKIEKGKN